mgnify:CR=1 FL=1
MTPEEIVENINEYVFWDAHNWADGYAEVKVLEFIQQAKSEWEKAAYGQGWIDGVNSIKNSKLNKK